MIRSGILVTHPITPNQQSITWKVYYYAGSQRVAMRVAEMPVTQPQPTPTPQPYPAPTPTQSAYQENFFDRFVAFLKDLFDVKAVSAAPLTVDAPVGEVYFLLTDYLGSTTMTVNVNGSVKAETRYGAWGNTRYTTGTTPTERQYTGQIEEEAGLYFYNARWYDSSLGRFITPDHVVPTTGEGNNPNAIGYKPKTNYLQLVVDYQEFQFLNQINQENRDNLILQGDFTNHEAITPLVPLNIMAYDRYAYVFNNPIRYIDPTGHSGVSPQDIGEWLRDTINLIWRGAPTWTNNLFEGTGRRIIQVDKPHLGYRFYHINSDLKFLKIIDHQNIDPLLAKAAAAKAAIDTTFASMTKGVLQITNSSSILLLERIPFFFMLVPSNWPVPLQEKA